MKESTRKEALNIVQDTIERLPFSQDKNIKQITFIVEKIVDELLNGKNIFMNLLDIKAVDDYTFDHCVDVNRNVVLNTGERGIVVDINRKFPSRPVVEVLYDESGQKLLRSYCVNLLEHNSIIIDDVVN